MNEKKIDFRCKIVSGRIVISLKDWISGICWTAIYLNWQLHVKNQQYKHKNKSEISSKLTIQTIRQYVALVSLFLTLNMFHNLF